MRRLRPKTRPATWIGAGLACLAALLAAGRGAPAQEIAAVDEESLKAAFVYRIASFVTWPDEALGPAGAPLRIAVVDDHVLADRLADLVADRRLGGRAVAVDALPGGATPASAQVVFLGRGADASAALARLARRPVLTMSDTPGFASGGGIVELARDGRRLRFEVNADAARRAGLKLSSQVLGLASRVHGKGAGS